VASASMNPGVSDLLQTLSNFNSPVLSSPAVTAALEKASPSDIVQLSAEATQLENVDAMFGLADSSGGSGDGLTSALASLEDLAAGSGTSTPSTTGTASASASPASTSTTSIATQLANYQAAVQSDEVQALLGDGSSSDFTGSLFDLTG
jgi:hypothetical protein